MPNSTAGADWHALQVLMAKPLSVDHLPGAAAAASQQDSDRVCYVPYYIPYAAASSIGNALQQQQLPLPALGEARQGSQQYRQRQPGQKLFAPGTMTVLQQALPAAPQATAVGCGARHCNENAAGADYQPAGAAGQPKVLAAGIDEAATASSAAAAAAANSFSCKGWRPAYQQTDDTGVWQWHKSLQQQQQQRTDTVPVDGPGSMCSFAADSLQSTELVAVGWLGSVAGTAACSGDDEPQYEYGLEQLDSLTPAAAEAAGFHGSEEEQEQSSAIAIAVPAATTGELDSLAAVQLVNPYGAGAAAAAGAGPWQGWKGGHAPRMAVTLEWK